jgi:hypothetical protein
MGRLDQALNLLEKGRSKKAAVDHPGANLYFLHPNPRGGSSMY